VKGIFLKVILSLFVVVSFSASASAQSSVWVVKGARATVYLAGSCHVLRASDHPLPAEFQIAYANARKIVFETPPGDLEAPEYVQKLMAVAIYTDGSSLQDHLTPAVYAKAEKFCKEHNFPFEQYQLFRPWMMSMMLAMQEMQQIGIEANYGVDHFYHQKAKKDGKAISGLETADEQLGLLSLMDGSTGNEQVSETIDDLLQLNGKIAEILTAWRTGDEAGIEIFNLRELKNYPQLYSTLIVDRNKKWVKKIENYLHAGENAMVIVGVGHLAGADGVVNLLRKRGLRVVQLQK
jgi:uncharacterized protein